jgi:hypothetical protein
MTARIMGTNPQINESNKDITDLYETAGYTVPETGYYRAHVRLSGLNALTATLTGALRVNASGTIQGESPQTVNLKLVTSATKALMEIGPVFANRGETIHGVFLSTNISDTAAGIAATFVDAGASSQYGRIA